VPNSIDQLVQKRFDAKSDVYWLAFSRVVESGQFLLYDTMLRERIMSFRLHWEEVMLKAKVLFSLVDGRNGELSLLDSYKWTTHYRQEVGQMEVALFHMDAALRLLLMQVHDKYIEIDVDASSRQARAGLASYL
jgi:hypothetical protein